MTKVTQEVSSTLKKIDTKVKNCYETQIRAFSSFDNRFFGQLIHDHKIENVLDVGCGEGSFILNLAKMFPQLNIEAVETIASLVAE